MSDFKLEQRYIVMKYKDVLAMGVTSEELRTLQSLAYRVDAHRQMSGKQPLDCVVVEKDWPEYQVVVESIAARVTS